ncbi:MAG: PilZ domain-containing protein [Nitrospira sp.]|nr:PilZ domain-containing protein [Nitrospira sp.]
MVLRQHPRYHASFSGTLVYRNHPHTITNSVDLSRKGCRLESSVQVVAGTRVDLLLYLSDEPVPVLIQHATIRWAGAHGIGIEFPSLASPHRERLDGTLQQLAGQPGRS